MKLGNPQSRLKLSIKKSYKVLDVGGGHRPHKRANVVVDKFVDTNYHRNGDIMVHKGQEFINADGNDLPFEDKSFDYIVCSHVLEHVEDPIAFLKEQERVAGRGYLETPSMLGEYMMPKESHKWVIQEIDDKLVLYDKDKLNFKVSQDFSFVFQDFLPKQSIAFKMLERTHPDLITVRYEWEGKIDILVNPEDEYYKSYFTQPWNEKKHGKLGDTKSMGREALLTCRALIDVMRSVFFSKVLKKPE